MAWRCGQVRRRGTLDGLGGVRASEGPRGQQRDRGTNPFPARGNHIVDFVKGRVDRVAMQSGVFLASVAPKAIPPAKLACLRRRFDAVQVVD